MSVLKIENLTKDYGHSRGVFDASFQVEEGEVFGFLGPNGSGKTTTIRIIMGFSRPDKGNTYVMGRDSWNHYHINQQEIGYIPGEIALPEALTGTQFIKMTAELRGLDDLSYTDYLLEKFQLETNLKIKYMSLGVKRKMAIVTAFMHDPKILVLDEPTSGLDPVMQDVFIEFIKEEKAKGKTILLSSHIFSEVDATCDKIAIIKEGHIISTFIADELRHNNDKTFKLEFNIKGEFEQFRDEIKNIEYINVVSVKENINQIKIHINDSNINNLIGMVSQYDLKYISEIKYTLEDHFMKFYDKSEDSRESGGAYICP